MGLLLTTAGGVLQALTFNPTLPVSQVPLGLATPGRPQVVIAVANSQSMDGTLSGAIMTGSGSLDPSLGDLSNASSPPTYAVPAGFTPPKQAADANGMAPYTVNKNGVLYDNGPSRMNVAKAGIKAVLQSYLASTDFALTQYALVGLSMQPTWVYYMSPMSPVQSDFVYTNTQVAGKRYAPNPCLNYMANTTLTASGNCTDIANAKLVDSATLSGSAYVEIGASSDDPNINDVLYGHGTDPAVFYTYGKPTPQTPYPTDTTLDQFNSSSVSLTYPNTAPSNAPAKFGFSNAGYIAFAQQVMYAQRGFGFNAGLSSLDGQVSVDLPDRVAYPAMGAQAIDSFLPFLEPETNDASTGELKSGIYVSAIAGLLGGAKKYLGSMPSASTGSCPPQKYVVLVSDGLPTLSVRYEDPQETVIKAMLSWPPLGSDAADHYDVWASFNADGSLANTNDDAVRDTITTLKTLNEAGIKTFIVGLGAGVDPSLNPQAAATLKAMAVAGGTVSYYPAASPAAFTDSLNSILTTVQNGTLSTTASAVNSSHLNTDSVEYQARLVSSDSPYKDWTGDLFAQALDPATGKPTGNPLWSAQARLDAQAAGAGWSTARRIATWNPALNAGAGGGVPFRWDSTDPTQGISPAQQHWMQPFDTQGPARLAYLRGDTSGESRNGGPYRNRSHLLGDIADSQAAYVGAPNGPFFTSSYFTFQKAHATRKPMLYVGANDGMLHAFDAHSGDEQFAFIPNAMFTKLYNLSAPSYNQNHRFFVDGSPQSGDVQFADGSWHTLLVGGENAGGQSVYALDITDPAALDSEAAVANAVKWEFTDIDMGLSFSQPVIAPIAASPKYAVFFGNGYNSPSNHSILFAVNPQTGQTLAKIDLCIATGVPAGTCKAGAVQGLSAVSVANADGLQGQAITKVYAGDLQGNLWAVDVSNADPARWTVKLLFQARDSAGNSQPITTAPVITLNPRYPQMPGLLVMFGTGQLLSSKDLSTTQTQSVYGVLDRPGSAGAYHRSDLQSQTLTYVTAAQAQLPQDILTATKANVDFSSTPGWYADMPIAGQRIVTDPQLLNGAFITTINKPPSSSCGIQPSPMLLELNYATGGAFPRPQLDADGNGVIDSNDNYDGNNPAGIGLRGTGSGSAATIVGPTPGDDHMIKIITTSDGVQQSVVNPNNNAHATAWWQIQ